MGSKYLRSCIWISPQFLESLRNHFVRNCWSFGNSNATWDTLCISGIGYAIHSISGPSEPRGRVQDNPPPLGFWLEYKQKLFLRTLDTSPSLPDFRPSYDPVSLLNWQNVDVFLHSSLGSGWIEGVTEQEKTGIKKNQDRSGHLKKAFFSSPDDPDMMERPFLTVFTVTKISLIKSCGELF